MFPAYAVKRKSMENESNDIKRRKTEPVYEKIAKSSNTLLDNDLMITIITGTIPKLTEENTARFRNDFDQYINSIVRDIDILSRETVIECMKEFTESALFERIYYKTNPYLYMDVDEWNYDVTDKEVLKFIELFWRSFALLIENIMARLSDKIDNMTKKICDEPRQIQYDFSALNQ